VSDALVRIAAYAPAAPPLHGEEAGAPAGARYLVLDVFTEVPLTGNPLAVVTDAGGIEPAEMQRIARELNLSETVFVLTPEGGGDVRIRIFTPAVELPFAGHPVLGSAIVIGTALGRERIVLETGSGEVPIELRLGGAGAPFGRMRQPVPSHAPFTRTRELLAALGVERSTLPVEQYVNGPCHVYVGIESEQALSAMQPDLRAIESLGALGVGCFAGSGTRWKSRNFAPGLGVPEDPATGSAAGPLAVHLARHGSIAFGQEIAIRQGEEIGRPSLLYASAHGSREQIERVEVAGHAVFVAAGELLRG
jgi:trans-2,3-dihydro-3-hydroxyanthranilate isomerase